MRPVAPRIVGLEEEHIDGDRFKMITVARATTADDKPCIVTRWRLTPEERAAIAAGDDLFIHIVGVQLQPIGVNVGWPYGTLEK